MRLPCLVSTGTGLLGLSGFHGPYAAYPQGGRRKELVGIQPYSIEAAVVWLAEVQSELPPRLDLHRATHRDRVLCTRSTLC